MMDIDDECPHLPRVPGVVWRADLCEKCCDERWHQEILKKRADFRRYMKRVEQGEDT